jgi:peptidoglycan/LPS O-acetylase OafA/YrhL
VLLWLLAEAIVGVFFYAFFTYMPDFAKAIIGMAVLAVILCDYGFQKRTNRKRRATLFFLLPFILTILCYVAWKTTDKEVWINLAWAGACLTAIYRVVDRRSYD